MNKGLTKSLLMSFYYSTLLPRLTPFYFTTNNLWQSVLLSPLTDPNCSMKHWCLRNYLKGWASYQYPPTCLWSKTCKWVNKWLKNTTTVCLSPPSNGVSRYSTLHTGLRTSTDKKLPSKYPTLFFINPKLFNSCITPKTSIDTLIGNCRKEHHYFKVDMGQGRYDFRVKILT